MREEVPSLSLKSLWASLCHFMTLEALSAYNPCIALVGQHKRPAKREHVIKELDELVQLSLASLALRF